MTSSLFQVLARRLAENGMKDLQKDLRYPPETLPILIPKNNDTPRSTQRGDTRVALNSRPQDWRTALKRRIPLGRMASSNSNYKLSSHYAANRTLPKKRLPRKTIWPSDYIWHLNRLPCLLFKTKATFVNTPDRVYRNFVPICLTLFIFMIVVYWAKSLRNVRNSKVRCTSNWYPFGRNSLLIHYDFGIHYCYQSH